MDPLDRVRRAPGREARRDEGPRTPRATSLHVSSRTPGDAPAGARAGAAPAPPRPLARRDDPPGAYAGEGGPARWAALRPEFAPVRASASARARSTSAAASPSTWSRCSFDYRPAGFAVVDNGHTVQVNVGAGQRHRASAGRRYELQQFHFHRPSEERIDGRQFEMVAHLVHKDDRGPPGGGGACCSTAARAAGGAARCGTTCRWRSTRRRGARGAIDLDAPAAGRPRATTPTWAR
ncbi:MAG: carbonic anhydrase family protein [Comamonadaceae bacterium]|nr:carbonic anhydrase family protein [Comamonadaceae bacterium]